MDLAQSTELGSEFSQRSKLNTCLSLGALLHIYREFSRYEG